MYGKNTRKGKFKPRKPEKYKGDPRNIVYRSGWELRVMKYLDGNPNVLAWASEELIIPYINPFDGLPHRYFPDFWVKFKSRSGEEKIVILEVKPHKFTVEPKKPKRNSRKYVTEMAAWKINEAKWLAATEYCKNAGVEFKVITENELH